MKLDEFHVEQFRARVICERLSVSGIFPGVAGDSIGAANAAGCQDNCLCLEEFESSALPVITERANDAIAILKQSDHGMLHVDVDSLMNTVVL